MKKLSVIMIGLAIMLAFVGAASAAVLPNATLETQGIASTTVIQCDGIVITSASFANENTNQMLDGAPLKSKEVYGASTYNSQMIAMSGVTQLVKTINMNTKDQVNNGKNIDVQTDLVYQGNDGGFVEGSESIAQFNAGQAGTKAADAALCPFVSAKDTQIPPFNEMVIMGSQYDMFQGTVSTTSGATTTAKTADVASQTEHSIEASGVGSVSAYMNLFAEDARGDGLGVITPATTTKLPDKIINKIIPGTTTTSIVTPATTTSTTIAGHFEGCKWIPDKTTVVNTNAVTKTVTTNDVVTPVVIPGKKVTTPAVIGAIPSASTTYHDYEMAIGTFTFVNKHSYTSGIVG